MPYSPATLAAALNVKTPSQVMQLVRETAGVPDDGLPGLNQALNQFLKLAGSLQKDAALAARHLEVGGSADAVGEHTLALGDNQVKMVDLGAVTIAGGSATYLAGAHSAQGQTTQAFADAFSDYDGFDFVFTYTRHGSGDGGDYTPPGEDLQWAAATTWTVAIDVEGWEFGSTPALREGKWSGEAGDWAFTEHVADVTADAQAFGDDAYVLTQTDAFANERFSHAAGSALAWML
jgi:hypothetical protein